MRPKIVIVGLISGAFALAASLVTLLPATPAQNNSRISSPSSLKEFYENGSSYFPPGTFMTPSGSPDDHFGDSIAWYLHEIGEPPLFKSAENSQAHAYRLIRIGFPAGKTLVLRLQIENDGTAKLFARKTPFDGTDFLLNREDSISITGVNQFLEFVKRGDFWQLPTRERTEPNVKDGTYWFLEGVHHGSYHMVYRRAPELNSGGFTDIGRYLAKDLAQVDR
jgi:hypothetical protein